MAAIDLNLDPTPKQLRQFGWIATLALPLAGWLFMHRPSIGEIHGNRLLVLGILAALGVVCGALASVRSELLKWPFVALSVATFPIGLVVGECVLLLIYGVAFVPMALLFRVLKRDALQRKLSPDAASYWQPKAQPSQVSHYYRQS